MFLVLFVTPWNILRFNFRNFSNYEPRLKTQDVLFFTYMAIKLTTLTVRDVLDRRLRGEELSISIEQSDEG